MQVLLEAPGKEFFSSAKQTRNKNKTTSNSPLMPKSSSKSSFNKRKNSRNPQVVPFSVHMMAQSQNLDRGHHLAGAK
jgi:hypothetical protein